MISMKKVIVSTILTLTLITGALVLIPMNNESNSQPEQSETPKVLQNTIETPVEPNLEPSAELSEPETTIHVPKEVETIVEASEGEEGIVNREPTFDELVIKYKISGDSRIQELSNLFDRRTRNAPSEDRFLQFMRQLGFDMTESRTIYDRDAVYTNWVKSLNDSSKNN